jgi:hypothetical protein
MIHWTNKWSNLYVRATPAIGKQVSQLLLMFFYTIANTKSKLGIRVAELTPKIAGTVL